MADGADGAFFIELWDALVRVVLEASPWLMIGLIAAGLIKTLIPDGFLARVLGKRGMGGVVKAALFGTPLPLCSCGVLPTAIGLRRQGASRESTVSFLIATPENGADSIALSYSLLGPVFAVVRPVAAIVSAVIAGALTLMIGEDRPTARKGKSQEPASEEAGGRCCSSKKETRAVEASGCSSSGADEKAEAVASCCSSEVAPAPAASSCCSSEAPAAEQEAGSCCGSAQAEPAAASSCCSSKAVKGGAEQANGVGFVGRVGQGLRFAFGDIANDIMGWLAVGLVAAALINVLVPAGAMATWGGGLTGMLVVLAISVPMYICAVASTPVAASLIGAGLSPGAALVFLLAGPATNFAGMLVVRKEMGWRTLAAYQGGVIGGALVFGLGLDWAVGVYGWELAKGAAHAHRVVPHWLAVGSSVVIVGLIVRVGYTKAVRTARRLSAVGHGREAIVRPIEAGADSSACH